MHYFPDFQLAFLMEQNFTINKTQVCSLKVPDITSSLETCTIRSKNTVESLLVPLLCLHFDHLLHDAPLSIKNTSNHTLSKH
jgi:hypothetical protein